MTPSLPDTPTTVKGPSLNIPTTLNLHSYLFSNPFQNIQSLHKDTFPNHAYEGHAIPPHRPILVHDRTGAVITWERARKDSLKIARYLRAIVGEPLGKEHSQGAVIHSPRTTLLLHLPNAPTTPLFLLGALAANLTCSPISTLLEPRELAYLLARSRPQVLVTSTGPQGEFKLREALQILLDAPEGALDDGQLKGAVVKAWAKELAQSWDRGKAALARKGELRQKVREQRVWTVDLELGGADYYGSGLQRSGRATGIDSRDWTHLLVAPPGSKGGNEGEDDAFAVSPMSALEQERRAAVLLWSSGTTGKSKGVFLTHKALVASTLSMWANQGAYNAVHRGEGGGGERWVALAPFNHIYGLSTLLLPAFAMGSTLIFPSSPRFEIGAYLRTLARYRATWGHIAPGVAVALPSSPHLSGVDLSSLKAWVSGGAPVPTDAALGIWERTRRALQMGYGATETGGTTQSAALSGPGVGVGGEKEDDLGSCGRPMVNVEIRIAAGDEAAHRVLVSEASEKRRAGGRAPVEPCAPGEVEVRGPTRCAGYASGLGSDEGNALDARLNEGAFTQDGWYRTGDVGTLDKYGNLWLTGRSKEIIKVKGFQVSPPELDELFTRHPAVLEAAAVGSLSSSGTESVELHVVPLNASLLPHPRTSGASPASGEEAQALEKQEALVRELASYCESLLAHYKWPATYVVRGALRRNAAGKLMRKEIAQEGGRRWEVRKLRAAKL